MLIRISPCFTGHCNSKVIHLLSSADLFFTAENNDAARFYRLREQFNLTTDPALKAALFIYLNRHGFNGLCRYNAAHRFNVPFGRYVHPYFPEAELRTFHHRLQQADLQCADFETVMQQVGPGDVVYCDPPYVPLSETAAFTAYDGGNFNHQAQERLAEAARACAARGAYVLLSNHDTPGIQSLYKGALIQTVQVPRFISCKGNARRPVQEVLALFHPAEKYHQGSVGQKKSKALI